MSDNPGRTVRAKQNITTDAGEIPTGQILTGARPTNSQEMVEVIWNGQPVWIPKSQVQLVD